MVDIASAGALVLLARNLAETVKTLGESIRGSRRHEDQQRRYDEVVAHLADYSSRLELLSQQLEQSERLTRMVPAWLEIANHVPFWKNPTELDRNELQLIDRDLRQLIFDSTSDHFSGTFFRTDFGSLPTVDNTITEFRTLLSEFDKTLSAVPAGNLDVFLGLWPSLSTQFNSVTNKAWELRTKAEDIQGALVREIGEAAREYRNSAS